MKFTAQVPKPRHDKDKNSDLKKPTTPNSQKSDYNSLKVQVFSFGKQNKVEYINKDSMCSSGDYHRSNVING